MAERPLYKWQASDQKNFVPWRPICKCYNQLNDTGDMLPSVAGKGEQVVDWKLVSGELSSTTPARFSEIRKTGLDPISPNRGGGFLLGKSATNLGGTTL